MVRDARAQANRKRYRDERQNAHDPDIFDQLLIFAVVLLQHGQLDRFALLHSLQFGNKRREIMLKYVHV